MRHTGQAQVFIFNKTQPPHHCKSHGLISHSVSFYYQPIKHSSFMHVCVCGLFCTSELPLDKESNSY